MADFFFFTDLEAVTEQTDDQAYGPVPGDSLSFRVNNRFTVTQNAPAIAITEGIPMVQQCATDSDCVNIVLFPIKNTDFDFPTIKLFIYRGIKKSSLFDTNDNLQPPNANWKTNNILQVVKDLQDKINADLGTNEVAKAENLGYHYSDPTDTENFKADTEFVESIIFLNDGLQLPLIKAGCQLGEFIGDPTKEAGLQLVLDRIGYEPTLGLVRAEDDVVTVNELTLTTEVAKFQHRHEKEAILTYVDPAALYGCARANRAKVRAYQNTADKTGSRIEATEAIDKFRNKGVCYIDIRNDYNYSFNYYNSFRDNLELSFEQNGTKELLITSKDYYEDWPLLRLIDQEVPRTNPESKIRIKLPINDIAKYGSRYFLRSYTHEFIEKDAGTNFQELNFLDPIGLIRKVYCEEILMKSWVNEEGNLGNNYFFFKYGKVQVSESSNDIFPRRTQYDFVFPLNIKMLLGDDIVNDGDFKVSLFSSENAPIVLKNYLDTSDEYYTQYIGIAKDKFNTTFFSFPDQIGYESGRRLKYPLSIVQQGKYDNSAFLQEFEYTQGEDSLGFLEVLPERAIDSSLVLKKIARQFNGQSEEFLYYLNSTPLEDNKFSIDARKFHAVTISNEEYDTVIALTGTNFTSGYKTFLDVDVQSEEPQNFVGFALGQSILKLKGIELNTGEDKVQQKELLVEDATTQENSELNFYVNKT